MSQKYSKGGYHDLKRLSPHLTGKPCAVKVARTVWSGGKTRKGSTYHYYNDNLYLKGAFRWRNAEDSHLSLKQKLCLRPSVVKLHKRNCVADTTSAKTSSQSGNTGSVENIATGFTSTDKHANEATERIAQLEQLVGRLTLALEIQKKASTLLS